MAGTHSEGHQGGCLFAWIANNLCVVLLWFARSTAALGDDFLETCFQVGKVLRLGGGEVLGLSDIGREVIELDGLALVTALTPSTGTFQGDVLEVFVSKAGDTADGTTYRRFPNRLATTFH